MSRINNEMAYVAECTYVKKIPDADAIECAIINGGWPCVVKVGEFKPGNLVMYCSIDSWVPTEIAPFLSKGKEPREYNGIKGERLRTVKLRKQLSQGLVLPLSVLPEGEYQKGDMVGDILGIQKWEAAEEFRAGNTKGSFPSFVPKTDEPRAQNLVSDIKEWYDAGIEFSVTEKVHGTSVTFIFNNGEFEVCSRNLALKPDEESTYWKQAIKYDIERKMRDFAKNIAIQGEIYGSKICGNQYGMDDQDLLVFNVFSIDDNRYLNHFEMKRMVSMFGLKHVPVISEGMKLPNDGVNSLLEFAEGKSMLNGSEREGLVFKSIYNPTVHFKLVSNKWLLGGGDEK